MLRISYFRAWFYKARLPPMIRFAHFFESDAFASAISELSCRFQRPKLRPRRGLKGVQLLLLISLLALRRFGTCVPCLICLIGVGLVLRHEGAWLRLIQSRFDLGC